MLGEKVTSEGWWSASLQGGNGSDSVNSPTPAKYLASFGCLLGQLAPVVLTGGASILSGSSNGWSDLGGSSMIDFCTTAQSSDRTCVTAEIWPFSGCIL
jgi:hypothetical protein